jgi:hypothetical protein
MYSMFYRNFWVHFYHLCSTVITWLFYRNYYCKLPNLIVYSFLELYLTNVLKKTNLNSALVCVQFLSIYWSTVHCKHKLLLAQHWRRLWLSCYPDSVSSKPEKNYFEIVSKVALTTQWSKRESARYILDACSYVWWKICGIFSRNISCCRHSWTP